MLEKLVKYLEYEEKLMQRLVRLAEEQQNALVGFNIKDLNKISRQQDEISKQLRQAESKRIRLLTLWFDISQQEATKLRLSTLEKNLKGDELELVKSYRIRMRKLITDLHTLNVNNRILANRAQYSVREVMAAITNGQNQVCNVKV